MRIINRNKLTAFILSLVMIGAAGCGADNSSSTAGDTSAEASESVSSEAETKAPETPEEFHAAMVARSLVSTGNTSRIKAKIEQARNGEATTIAYLGGSITEGYTVQPDECYAKLSYDYFAETYGTGDNVRYVNAGLSGTPSNLGILRLQRDVLDYHPDIVFIEYAVNDAQDNITKQSYESIVKTVLSQENAPAVVLMLNRTEEGYTAQDYMKEIGEYYELPVISTVDALTPELDEGRISWKDYYNDASHPGPNGHKLFCEFIENMYTASENAPDDGEYKIKPGGRFGTPYENAVMITPENEDTGNITITSSGSFEPSMNGRAGFPASWHYNGGSEPMKLSVSNASAFFMIYKRNNSDSMGSVDVYLNGEKLTSVNANDKDGWGDPMTAQIIKFSLPKAMEIEIRAAEGSEEKTIDILGFGYAENESF
ncbi:MAG: SGNH/GDSL hydrolase family protein [Huintestinicola sp.]